MNIFHLCSTILILLLPGFGITKGQDYGYKPEKLPEILNDSLFSGTAINIADKIYGFSGHNYSRFDFRNVSIDILKYQAFDIHTKWPDEGKLPEYFNPSDWLEKGKNPGLNINKLHRDGITGKGISVAIFDKPINKNHKEIKDKIVYIPVDSRYTKEFQKNRIHFHGIGCASILCGETTGVAPDVKLYYFAVADDANNSYNYCLALEKLFIINDTLPENRKIKIVSISDNTQSKNWSSEIGDTYNRWKELEQEAKKRNISIIYSSLESAHKYFAGGGCPPFKNKELPDNYDYSTWVKSKRKIILPADFRTTADNETDSTFTYHGEGGFSWAIPYLAGLAALSLQINPDLEIEEIYKYLDESKYIKADGKYIVNPAKFIELIKKTTK